ncbi:MAG: hypothetical protein ACK5Y2_08990 [Bdellovibrionales bacterium]
MRSLFLFLMVSLFSFGAGAQTPVVGREAAAQYFGESQEVRPSGPSSHYMALHIGKLVNTEAWRWGDRNRRDDAGSLSLGVTYRIREWHQTDFAIRLDFNEYDIDGEKPQKLSFLPMIFFPEASAEFPLYFGAGIGPGIFFKQVSGESSVALDYQLVVGIRFFDVFENAGFFLESGLKNHIQLGDDGQVNSAFITTGALFTF